MSMDPAVAARLKAVHDKQTAKVQDVCDEWNRRHDMTLGHVTYVSIPVMRRIGDGSTTNERENTATRSNAYLRLGEPHIKVDARNGDVPLADVQIILKPSLSDKRT